MAEEPNELRHCSGGAVGSLPARMVDDLYTRFPPRRLGYIARVLTAGEIAVLPDAGDALIIARIKRMPHRRLHQFDRLVPADPIYQRHFQSLQLQWLRDEEWLLGTRLGRKPTHPELSADFTRFRNGSRFRAYFALKYPRKMRYCGRGGPPRKPQQAGGPA